MGSMKCHASLHVLVRTALAVLLLSGGNASAVEEARLPKYGPAAERLFQSREFVRGHEAPDFWGLMPYYVSQSDDRSCSVACVAMLTNALRAERELRADQPLATPMSVLQAVAPPSWRDKLGPEGEGVTLDELAMIVGQVLAAYDVQPVRVDVVRFPETPEEALPRLRRLLTANERSGRDLVLVNFLQSSVTGDPAGNVGHFAPIAAYDGEQRRALLLDPDRHWYEPYWVPDSILLESMATRDPVNGRLRGLLHISVNRE